MGPRQALLLLLLLLLRGCCFTALHLQVLLKHDGRHPLYQEIAQVSALRHNLQPPTLHTNVTNLAFLKAELEHTESVKTFIIISTANNSAVLPEHECLFRYLYHSKSKYLQAAYPPCVIVHTGDTEMDTANRNLKVKYQVHS